MNAVTLMMMMIQHLLYWAKLTFASFFFFFLLVVNVIFFWVLYFCFLFSDFDLIYLISFSFEYDVVEFLYFIKIYE